MEAAGRAKRVRIYVNEGDVAHHKPVQVAVLELLRANNTAGATVLRAIEGFGGSGQIHTTRVVDSDWKLPIVIEWIDAADRVARLLPALKQLVRPGLITVDDTEVVLFSPQPMRDLPSGLTAGEVTSPELAIVAPDVPVREVVETLLRGAAHESPPGVVCVVEGDRLVGVITSSDLVRRGGVPVRMGLLAALDIHALHAELATMSANRHAARDIMTPSPVVVYPSTRLVEVAALMARGHFKRVPVVDAAGLLAGVVRRADLLRTVGERFDAVVPAAPGAEIRAATTLEEMMRPDVPTVHPDTPLQVVLQAVIATRLNCAVVVDAERRPVGVVTDAELLERVTPALRPSALRSLVHRLPFSHPGAEALAAEQHARARTAADLMSPDVRALPATTPLASAIASALAGRHKLVVVVDAEGRLAGVVDHDDILRGLVEPPAAADTSSRSR